MSSVVSLEKAFTFSICPFILSIMFRLCSPQVNDYMTY
jgi:hypothetical protein